MGSSGVKRRKPRPRRRVTDPDAGGWEMKNSPYTFEGQIEGLGRLGRGLSGASPRMRLAAKLVAAAFLLPFVVGIVNWALG